MLPDATEAREDDSGASGPTFAGVSDVWRRTCNHDVGPVPCTVLDPFAGAGTAMLVADRLGRHGVGIELNPEYAEMARRRMSSDCPMCSSVEVIASPICQETVG